MLLALCDFLEKGDVTGFAPDDRREWTKHVLSSVRDPVVDDTVGEDGVPKLSSAQEAMLEEATDIVITRTWRDTLMGLRTLYPGAGNYSGVGKELDSTNNGIFVRIIEMKDAMLKVMKTQEALYNQKSEDQRLLLGNGTLGSSGGNVDESEKTMVPLNIYASNVDAMIRANDSKLLVSPAAFDDEEEDFVIPDD